jgi:hypothetical protein
VDNLRGITLGRWLRLLQDNGFAIDRGYWERAWIVTVNSLNNSRSQRLENRQFGEAIARAAVQPPLFILGHWRTGTTLLHELLIQDPQFAYPNVYEVANPHDFLTNEDRIAELLKEAPAQQRPMDRMEVTINSPGEDEVVMAVLSLRSPLIGWAFPRREAYYDRYYTFRDVPAAEVAEWQRACLWFYKKLTVRYSRPLVLKSPPHTGRVRTLLELFPEARFVHIMRDPYTVFRSTRHLHERAVALSHLQRPPANGQEAGILRRYALMYAAYLEDRHLIPPGRLCEVRFEDLERDLVGQVELIYRQLGLPGFSAARPRLEAYARAKAGYQKNDFEPLPEPLRERIAQAWARYFQAWGYSV